MFHLILTLVIAAPVILVALAIKSKWTILFGILFALAIVFGFLWTSFSQFVLSLRAKMVDPQLDARLQNLWKRSVHSSGRVRFWIYPTSKPEFKVWAPVGRRLEVFFSLGTLELATDEGIAAAFKTVSETKRSVIRAQNRRHALTHRLERLKGSETAFRYWFVSFWLYPLERLLKVAKI